MNNKLTSKGWHNKKEKSGERGEILKRSETKVLTDNHPKKKRSSMIQKQRRYHREASIPRARSSFIVSFYTSSGCTPYRKFRTKILCSGRRARSRLSDVQLGVAINTLLAEGASTETKGRRVYVSEGTIATPRNFR